MFSNNLYLQAQQTGSSRCYVHAILGKLHSAGMNTSEVVYLIVVSKQGLRRERRQAKYNLKTHLAAHCLFHQVHFLTLPSLSRMLWNCESISVLMQSWSLRPHDELLSKKNPPLNTTYSRDQAFPCMHQLAGRHFILHSQHCCLSFTPFLMCMSLEPRVMLLLVDAVESPTQRGGRWWTAPWSPGLLMQSALLMTEIGQCDA